MRSSKLISEPRDERLYGGALAVGLGGFADEDVAAVVLVVVVVSPLAPKRSAT